MAADNKGFDARALFGALESTVIARGRTWKQVAAETGVSASTLTRMAHGRGPDAASLAAVSAWAGLNPSDFVRLPQAVPPPRAHCENLGATANGPTTRRAICRGS